MIKQRLPLAVPFSPRDSVQDKGATAINTFMDIDPMGTAYATKRAGYILKTSSITATLNKGIIFNTNQGLLYYINNNTVPVNIP